jgi:hypothetical protein
MLQVLRSNSIPINNNNLIVSTSTIQTLRPVTVIILAIQQGTCRTLHLLHRLLNVKVEGTNHLPLQKQLKQLQLLGL